MFCKHNMHVDSCKIFYPIFCKKNFINNKIAYLGVVVLLLVLGGGAREVLRVIMYRF